MRTGLVAVAQVDEGDAGEGHLDEGGATVAQRPCHAVKLQRQPARTLQLRSHHPKILTMHVVTSPVVSSSRSLPWLKSTQDWRQGPL